jgi:hypothetical protein
MGRFSTEFPWACGPPEGMKIRTLVAPAKAGPTSVDSRLRGNDAKVVILRRAGGVHPDALACAALPACNPPKPQTPMHRGLRHPVLTSGCRLLLYLLPTSRREQCQEFCQRTETLNWTASSEAIYVKTTVWKEFGMGPR